MATDGATGRSGGETAAAERCPVPVRAASDTRPWPERQPHVLWQCVFDSGHVTMNDARRCMLVCRLWRKCVGQSPSLRRSISEYNALGLVFNSGYITQGDAIKCMQVCRQWHACVHGAANLWQCIDFDGGGEIDPFDNWSDAMADAIAAKRPKEIVFWRQDPTRRQMSAILRRNAQLRRLTFCDCTVDQLRALDSLQAPLHSLVVTPQAFYDEDYDFAEILTSAPMLSQLTELHLAAYVGDRAAQLIAANFTQLNVMRMDAPVAFSPAGLRHLCADTAHTRTTLRRLELPWSCFRGGDAAECILAMPNLERLGVRDGDAQWAAEMRRAYKQRHNRDLVVYKLP